MLMAMFVLGFGCVTNPLEGWHFSNLDPNKVIAADYLDYIQKLPSSERKYAYYAHSFEDGTGKYAVQIEIPLNGTWWEHVLIYDKDNKRIKTIKYSNGHYAS
jgi:hypothetical protein